ncbi:MAG: endonuclease MutS2 [Thermodesulfobacteriota bacterium]|nr:endonuclease MutS2 [Thermodesulfobacteriota bacterium]
MISREALQTLEFDKILDILSGFSHSDASAKAILDISPLNNQKEIERRFGQVKEIRELAQAGTPLRLAHFQDISQALEQVRLEGAVLEARELVDFVPVLRIVAEISSQIEEARPLPLLRELAANLTGFPDILAAIERSIDSEGNILDSASPALFHLRTQIRALEAKITKRLEAAVRDKKTALFLQDDFITKRAGRWVIPVRMDSKGQVPGVVHDISRSGETAFTEPLEIIGIANELENLVAEAKAEEIRILRTICQMIRKVLDEIAVQYRTIVYLDILNSIARFADHLQMDIPAINDSSDIKLVKARHPLLMLAQKDGVIGEVVPLDLRLGGDNTAMVITGPNAGGKTVAIKTVGLLLLMALSGIPVPADSSSAFPLASKLLLDIGDEQSIESNLSTFSAHVSHIAEILKEAGAKTIVLLDELGTGTDPAEGAAISCAVIKDLKGKGSLIFATTHLMDIVGFVYKTEGMINASMEFDHGTLSPIYRLKVGEPGQSHALEIARKYGLPAHVLEFAKNVLGNVNVEFHKLLTELKEKRAAHEEGLNELQRQRAEVKEEEKLLNEKLAEVERLKTETMEKAYQESRDIVSEVKRQAYAVLEEVKKDKKRAAVKRVVRIQQEVEDKLREFDKEPSLSISEIKEGDTVFIRSVGYDATVMRVDRSHRRVRVKAGKMEWEVPVSDIVTKKGKVPEVRAASDKRAGIPETVPDVLNLIGLRVDEALSELEPFFNHAALAERKEVTIIHGLGTGILRKAVREYLTGHPLVEQFRGGELSEGGDGVTIATLR